jgi:hypothetical protein
MDGLRYPGRFRPAYLPGLQIKVQFYIPDVFGETGSFTIFTRQDYLNINRIFHRNFAAAGCGCKGKLVSRT